MIAPSGGFCPAGSSGGSGVSVFLFHRTRVAACGANRCAAAPTTAVVTCRSGVMSSRIQNDRPCVPDHQVVVLDDEVADRRRRHVQPQRLPVVAVVERDVDRLLGAGEEQARVASDPRAPR